MTSSIEIMVLLQILVRFVYWKCLPLPRFVVLGVILRYVLKMIAFANTLYAALSLSGCCDIPLNSVDFVHSMRLSSASDTVVLLALATLTDLLFLLPCAYPAPCIQPCTPTTIYVISVLAPALLHHPPIPFDPPLTLALEMSCDKDLPQLLGVLPFYSVVSFGTNGLRRYHLIGMKKY